MCTIINTDRGPRALQHKLWYLLRRRTFTPNRRKSATISRASSILTQAPWGLGNDKSHLRHPWYEAASTLGFRPHFIEIAAYIIISHGRHHRHQVPCMSQIELPSAEMLFNDSWSSEIPWRQSTSVILRRLRAHNPHLKLSPMMPICTPTLLLGCQS